MSESIRINRQKANVWQDNSIITITKVARTIEENKHTSRTRTARVMKPNCHILHTPNLMSEV